MKFIGKNAYQRLFRAFLASDQGLNEAGMCKTGIHLTEADSESVGLLVSLRGNDVGHVYMPIRSAGAGFLLLTDAESLKADSGLKLIRKNPKHLARIGACPALGAEALFVGEGLFARESPPPERHESDFDCSEDICIFKALRDIINLAYVQSSLTYTIVDLAPAERQLRLRVAEELERTEKRLRQRISLCEQECVAMEGAGIDE